MIVSFRLIWPLLLVLWIGWLVRVPGILLPASSGEIGWISMERWARHS